MLKYYFKSLRSIWFLIYMLTVVFTVISFQLNQNEIPVDYWVITNHSITMFVNNAFLLYSFVRTEALSRIKNQVIIRMTRRKTILELIRISLFDLLFYFSCAYGLVLLLNLLEIVAPLQCIIFLLINLLFFMAYELIFIFSILEYFEITYTLIPFVLNILFHYTIVPLLFY